MKAVFESIALLKMETGLGEGVGVIAGFDPCLIIRPLPALGRSGRSERLVMVRRTEVWFPITNPVKVQDVQIGKTSSTVRPFGSHVRSILPLSWSARLLVSLVPKPTRLGRVTKGPPVSRQ